MAAGSGWLRSKIITGIFCSALAAVRSIPSSAQQREPQVCEHSNSPAAVTMMPLSYPEAAEESTALVRELLDPFSLEDFAEKFWERKPLIIRGRPNNYYDRLVGFGLDDVDSVIENGVSLSATGEEPMVLGSDWNIVRRVFKHTDGEFWTAGLPLSAVQKQKNQEGGEEGGGEEGGRVSPEDARKAFQRGGFSLVINRLQRRSRSVSRVALALEDVLGQLVNANLYMTPPQRQAFEAHFDWMDGIIVQLAGSKTWVLYDEMVPFPRVDQHYKPASADLGEPIAVIELHPGDMMYIPRGWPHEAAVNGTGARPRAEAGRPLPSAAAGATGPSLHVTFGVQTAPSGTYESLLHHALEVAAVQHPLLFGLPPHPQGGEEAPGRNPNNNGQNKNIPKEKRSADGAAGDGATVEKDPGLPWLQLLHLWVHEVAFRESRLRKAVPLAPLFASTSPPTPTTTAHDNNEDKRGGVCPEEATPAQQDAASVPPAVLQEFQKALEACTRTADGTAAAAAEGGASRMTLTLLDSLLEGEQLARLPDMFLVGGGGGGDVTEEDGAVAAAAAAAGTELGEEKEDIRLFARVPEEEEWSRATLEAFDRTSFTSSSLREKLEGFLEVVSAEGALKRMVLAAVRRARDRAAVTERDLGRSNQSRA